MSKKVRSVFWIVSTHILTTGLAVPAGAGIVSTMLISQFGIRNPLFSLYIVATCSVFGCIGGTLYSLNFLRNEADCVNWKRCTLPSIITFAILALVNLGFEVYVLKANDIFTVGLLTASFLVSFAAFAVLTSSGFARMPVSEPDEEPDEVLASRPQTAKGPANRKSAGLWIHKRVIAAAAGFAIGLIVGVAITFNVGGKGAPFDWQNRLLTGLVVGGIGALLGLISGNVRL
jgi:hypothetical protein